MTVSAMPTDRQAAYTTLRTDVFELVPPDACRILDVGCSNGELGEVLRRAVPGRTVVGIDANEAFCAHAAMRLDKVVQSDINTIQWSSVFSSEEFDCLIFADILEHLHDPWERLSSACHHVRPGGTVIVSVPNIRHISALHRIFFRGQFPRNARGLFDGTHLRWFTLSDAASLVEQAGLMLEQSIFNLRLRDQGGGTLNKLAIRLLTPLLGFYPIREFFTYQVCMRARKPRL